MKETAQRVGAPTGGGASYFYHHDYLADQMRLSEQMRSVSRLVGNLGTSDKASNYILEQRNLLRAQAKENKVIRDLIDDKVRPYLF
jgi:hypothetical protein